MSMFTALNIAGSALTAERFRTNMILQNIANSQVTRAANGEPYRRKQVVFEERPLNFQAALQDEQNRMSGKGGVRVAEVVESQRDFVPVYDPSHPDANEEGYVMYPNVNNTEEQLDLLAATRAYEANVTALNLVKSMMMKALEVGR